jgi:hypothetical protein
MHHKETPNLLAPCRTNSSQPKHTDCQSLSVQGIGSQNRRKQWRNNNGRSVFSTRIDPRTAVSQEHVEEGFGGTLAWVQIDPPHMDETRGRHCGELIGMAYLGGGIMCENEGLLSAEKHIIMMVINMVNSPH